MRPASEYVSPFIVVYADAGLRHLCAHDRRPRHRVRTALGLGRAHPWLRRTRRRGEPREPDRFSSAHESDFNCPLLHHS